MPNGDSLSEIALKGGKTDDDDRVHLRQNMLATVQGAKNRR